MTFHVIVYKPNNASAREDAVQAGQQIGTPNIVVEATQVEHAVGQLASQGLTSKTVRALVFGGDGTLLAAARALTLLNDVTHKEILGINRGNLGFLTSYARSFAQGLATLEDQLADCVREPRQVLGVQLLRQGEVVFEGKALNDVVLDRGNRGKSIRFQASQGGKHIFSLRGDGIILSTPTGSTAYSLAAQGPLLYPSMPCLILNPFNVHSLNARPVVISNTLDVELIAEEGGDVHLDGQIRLEALPGDILQVGERDTVTLLHPSDYNWFQRLRDKFNWTM